MHAYASAVVENRRSVTTRSTTDCTQTDTTCVARGCIYASRHVLLACVTRLPRKPAKISTSHRQSLTANPGTFFRFSVLQSTITDY